MDVFHGIDGGLTKVKVINGMELSPSTQNDKFLVYG